MMNQPKTPTYPVFVGVKMTPAMAETIRQDAQRTGSSMSDVIRRAVTAQLNNSPEVTG